MPVLTVFGITREDYTHFDAGRNNVRYAAVLSLTWIKYRYFGKTTTRQTRIGHFHLLVKGSWASIHTSDAHLVNDTNFQIAVDSYLT
jgi:hypothetical protein